MKRPTNTDRTLTLVDLTTYQRRVLLVLSAAPQRLADLQFAAGLSLCVSRERRDAMNALVTAGLAATTPLTVGFMYHATDAGELLANRIYAECPPPRTLATAS